MNKQDLDQICRLTDDLLLKRGILKLRIYKKRPPVPVSSPIVKYFAQAMKNQLWMSHCCHGDAIKVLQILLDDANLVTVFAGTGNRTVDFKKLIPKGLKNNKTWEELSYMMLNYTSKGKGAGEFFFPFVAQDCQLIKSSEGKHDGLINGLISEYKKDGASLTPYPKVLRVIDDAVDKVFQGNRPGPLSTTDKRSKGQNFARFRTWLDAQKNPQQILNDFFAMLWPEQNTTALVAKLLVEKDGQKFYNIIGQHVCCTYQKIDGWQQLIVIGKTSLVIIEDPSNLSMFPELKFKWITKRGGDTQSLCDGYANIKIE